MVYIIDRDTGEIAIEVTNENFEKFGLEDRETFKAIDSDSGEEL